MNRKKKTQLNTIFKINWRDVWYSTVIWILGFLVAGLVILPWFYLVLPFVVFWTTTIYFKNRDKSLINGLWCSLFWFFAVLALDIFEIIGPYYSNVSLYFSDFRNLMKYPIILLIPVIYALVWESQNSRRKSKKSRIVADLELASPGGI